MAAVLGRTEVGVRETGTTVTVPNNPKARLMYYLSCISSVLDLKDTANIQRLGDYKTYYNLTESDTDSLVTLCILLSPDELIGKVIFQDDRMCGSSSNKFFEISAVSNRLLVTDSILVGGQSRAVSKIMVFRRDWISRYWVEPMKTFAPRLARIAGQAQQELYGSQTPLLPRAHKDEGCCCCTIL